MLITKYILTIKDLEIHPVEIEVNSFAWGSNASSMAVMPTVPIFLVPDLFTFTIQKGSDKLSPSLQHASVTGKLMQVSLRVDTKEQFGPRMSLTYLFRDSHISNVQFSGVGQEATESVYFNFQKLDINFSSDDVGSLYKGPHKGRTKIEGSDYESRF